MIEDRLLLLHHELAQLAERHGIARSAHDRQVAELADLGTRGQRHLYHDKGWFDHRGQLDVAKPEAAHGHGQG